MLSFSSPLGAKLTCSIRQRVVRQLPTDERHGFRVSQRDAGGDVERTLVYQSAEAVATALHLVQREAIVCGGPNPDDQARYCVTKGVLPCEHHMGAVREAVAPEA